ncbi:hypothetical protein C0Q70_21392 [Pomacea canaliculata]|uniref:Uncharacterized protein n=2 Tax=Pomacea canaliculata TaxID=400727 RepID=A0A2T7NCE1_POMCA|nr:hypothetical protein C0Q70_21392 [Pomacea canaliculata]
MSPIVFAVIAAIIPGLFGGLTQGLAVPQTTRPSLDYLRQEVNRLYQLNSYLRRVSTNKRCDYYRHLCQQRSKGHAWGYEGQPENEQARGRWSFSGNDYNHYSYYYNLYSREYNDLMRSLDNQCRRCFNYGLPSSTPATTTTTTEAPTTTQSPTTPEPTTTTSTIISMITSAIQSTVSTTSPVICRKRGGGASSGCIPTPAETTSTTVAPLETTGTTTPAMCRKRGVPCIPI